METRGAADNPETYIEIRFGLGEGSIAHFLIVNQKIPVDLN